jgi:hypothetical protein
VQIAGRDETAIIYDPALEYVTRFYSPERGDIILNPLDVRAPYWSPGEEVQHDAEALTMAHALFHDAPNETPFFLDSVRKLFAHLLRAASGSRSSSLLLATPVPGNTEEDVDAGSDFWKVRQTEVLVSQGRTAPLACKELGGVEQTFDR